MTKKLLTIITLVSILLLLGNGVGLSQESYDIAVVLPSMESQYWGQYVELGCRNAALDIEEKYDVDINYTVEGPTAESETESFLNILENVVSKRPDGIVLGNLIPDATAPIVQRATNSGIRVNLVSIELPLEEDQFGTLYYCDQPQQGELAAEAFYDLLKKNDLPLDGIVGVHMSVVVPVLEEKIDAFRNNLKELAPELELLDTQYNENDINNGISLVENQFATYGEELVGFFGGNNVTGNAIARAVDERGNSEELVTIAVDSDEQEIKALREGNLDALIVQTPYEQGYKAFMNVFEHISGEIEESPNEVNIPAKVVTKENMDEPEMKRLLDPTILERDKQP